ncbi:MAG: ECF transporter S component [Anaerolineales bacterium]|nr:ECF transporter S component [Anaerolineales bacterium]
MANTPGGEREFVGKGMAKIFGAPISWIALFGALMGALAIVPMLFYPTGGGFASAGMVIFGPLSGMLLGPWAGLIAGLIAGIIGMFISPGSYPLGLVDAFFSGGLLPLMWGLVHPRYRKIGIWFFAANIVIHFLVPYVIPGQGADFDPMNWGQYAAANSWIFLGYLMYLFASKPLWKAMESEKVLTVIIATILWQVAPVTAWMAPWEWIYYLFLHYPFGLAIFSAVNSWWAYLLPVSIAAGVVTALLVRAIKQTGLPHVTGSLLDREGF